MSVPFKNIYAGGGYIGDDDFNDDNEGDKNMDRLLKARKTNLESEGVKMVGSELAWLRSRLVQEKRMREMQIENTFMGSNGNVFVVKGGVNDGIDEDDDNASDVSDTGLIADYVVNIVEGRMGNFVLEELMTRFGGGPAGKISKKKGKEEEYSIEVRDELDRILDDFQFYYDRLEVPVSRLKIKLLRELLAKVDRVPSLDEEEDNSDDDEDYSNKTDDVLKRGTEVYYFDKVKGELRDAIVKNTHFDDVEPYYTITFVDDENAEKQTARAHLTKKWKPKVEEEEEKEEEEEIVEDKPRLEWSRYKDDRGHNYYYNNRTGASTYMNPYVKRQQEDSSSEEEEEEVFPLPKDPELLGFLVFCTVLVQKHFRGNKTRKVLWHKRCTKPAKIIQKRARGMLGRNAARRLFAKQIRKTFEGGSWIYEDITTKQIFFERPVIFKFLFPNSTF